MRRVMFGLVLVSLLSLGVVLGAACGDDDDEIEGDQSTAESQNENTGPDSAGAIVPNTFLTYEGGQYRLSDILQADLEDESQFSEVGEATAADVDAPDLTVFSKEGDADSVYTFWAGSGSGDTATPDSWYRWEPVD